MSALTPYRVLARKYRPQRFADLLGQEAMVTTLGNAIAAGRIAQAYLLSGVRGVGKTSTARLIAKALNCIGPDGQGGPTIDPCGVCEPCRAISEGRFIDVLELDAASNTGVEKMRELLDGVPYSPVAARFKVYVIDEVHMLSNSAFNALLKTLEEPPPHAKFLFATTEVRKLPPTILSRCQRFDLRRIPADLLAAHYARVCEAEQVSAEAEALALIARAAEGSARDGLSILDQAIAHGGGVVTAAVVSEMLGLADRGRVRALMSALLEARPRDVLAELRAMDALGTDPLAVLDDLLDLAHGIAASQAGAPPAGRPAEESADLARWAQGLRPGAIHRLWQLLLKGRGEVGEAERPLEAAEMALLRVCHAAGLPDPAELLRRPAASGDAAGAPGTAGTDSVLPSSAPAAAAHGTPAAVPVNPAGADPRLDSGAAPAGAGPGAGPSVAVATLRPAPTTGAAAAARGDEPAAGATGTLPGSFAGLVRLFEDRHESVLAALLHDRVRAVRYAPPILEVAPVGQLPADFALRVGACIQQWTGQRLAIVFVPDSDVPTLGELEARVIAALPEDPALRPIFEAFPAARLLDYDPSSASDAAAAGGEALTDPDAPQEERA